MASDEAAKRVEELLKLSAQRTDKQDRRGATRLLREAQAIDPNDDRVVAALQALALEDVSDASPHSEEGGETRTTLAAVVASFPPEPTKVFKELWREGDHAIKTLVDAVLDPKIWPSESQRKKSEHDALALLLAKLFEPNLINIERAMRGIARLMAADAAELQQLIDDDTFAAIASSLHIQHSVSLRTQTTLAIAKFLDAAPERGQELLIKFVVLRMTGQDYDTLIIALSAASAMFPFVRKAAVALFLTEGFCDNLMDVSDRSNNSDVTNAVLELLNAACIEKPCREAICKSASCINWLQNKLEQTTKTTKDKALAAVILSKISQESPGVLIGGPNLLKSFKTWVQSPNNDLVMPLAVEGLMFETVSPKAKEDLANDSKSLKGLTEVLTRPEVSFLYAGLTVFLNLTEYPEQLSQEGQKLAQLKSYANAKAPGTSAGSQERDPLDDDEHATGRCKKVLDAGIIPALVTHYKTPSPIILRAITSIALAVSKHPKHRGKMVQEGCFKMVLELSNIQGQGEEQDTIRREAALILAHLLIPIDPNLLFSGNNARAVPQAIQPLLHLLTTPYPTRSGSTDLRPVMEALRALTNLATVGTPPNSSAQDAIFAACWPLVPEELTTHHHVAIRRAAVQLVCNMAAHPGVQAWFGDRAGRGASRTRQIVALTQADDLETELGAGGALVGLTAHEGVVSNLVEWERGVPILMEVLKMGEGMMARGLAVVGNVIVHPQGKSALRNGDAKKVVQDLVAEMEGKNGQQGLVETLRALLHELDQD